MYSKEWRELRRREQLCWIVAISFAPAAAGLILALALVLGDVPNHFGVLLGGGWLAAFALASFHRLEFRCPRCQRHYFGWREGLARDRLHCAACGLSRDAEEDGAGPDLYRSASLEGGAP